MPSALVLAIHFTSWKAGARFIIAANASLIVNLAPLAMPFLLSFLAHDRVTRRELGGTLVALFGVLVLTGGDLATRGESVRRNFISFASLRCFAGYLSRVRVDLALCGAHLRAHLSVLPRLHLPHTGVLRAASSPRVGLTCSR